jgi:hypothetical protein
MRFRSVAMSVVMTWAVVGGLLVGTAANASEGAQQPAQDGTARSIGDLPGITAAQLDSALAEARSGGFARTETTSADGTTTTTLDLGEGLAFDVVTPPRQERIGAGSDAKGAFVSFNATDQNMILSGSAFALGAAVCAVSAGTSCVVVGAILTAATVAITGSGAIRCGTRHLRVYPFAGGRVKPRCV